MFSTHVNSSHRAIFESQVPACYSVLWPEGEKIAAGNALYYVFRSLATCVMYLSNGFVLPVTQLVVLFVVLNFGAVCLMLALNLKKKKSRFW